MKCLKLDQVSIFEMFDSHLGITKHKMTGVVKVRVMEYKKREEIQHGGSNLLSRFFTNENVKTPTASKRFMVGSFDGRV